MSETLDSRFLKLHPGDNVLTVISPLGADDEILLEGRRIPGPGKLGLGHKVAARVIAPGEKIVKYGVPIGSASRAIAAGEHVHTQNLQSDYLPTWLREDQARLFAQPPHP